ARRGSRRRGARRRPGRLGPATRTGSGSLSPRLTGGRSPRSEPQAIADAAVALGRGALHAVGTPERHPVALTHQEAAARARELHAVHLGLGAARRRRAIGGRFAAVRADVPVAPVHADLDTGERLGLPAVDRLAVALDGVGG